MRALAKKLLRRMGYDVVRSGQPGRDPVADVQRLFGARPPETIFDVGANEGQTAIEYAKAFPKSTIYSFEPFDAAFDKLQRAASSFGQIRPVRCALGDVVGSKTLFLNSASVTNSLLPNAPEGNRFQPIGMATPEGKATVVVSTVDAHCQQHQVRRIDILKTDTQGYDLSVLRGADQLMAEQGVAVVFTELLFAPLYSGQAYFESVYTHLLERGFRLVNLYSVWHADDMCAAWCDGLFVHPEVLARSSREAQRG